MPDFIEKFRIEVEHACYPDHFPGATVVPGAVLIQWLVEALCRRNPAFQLRGISSFKFIAPVFPGDLVQINFLLSDEQEIARVECLRKNSNGFEIVAKGKLILGFKT